LCFGDSHLTAINRGYDEVISAGAILPFTASFFPVHGTNSEELFERVKTDSAIHAIVSLYGGNSYFVHGALNHPRPFDFYLPHEPHLPISRDAELLPYDFVWNRFISDLRHWRAIAEGVRSRTKLPIYQLSPPPPVGDSAAIARHIPKEWVDDLGLRGVATPTLRYKLWTVHVGVMQQLSRSLAIKFVAAPRTSSDREGYLKEEYRWDAFHATPSYGKLIVHELANLLQTISLVENRE
jgi:hypothetical protein